MTAESRTSCRLATMWSWACGFSAPWRRALTAAESTCSTVVPQVSKCSSVHLALRAISTDPDEFSHRL